MRFLGLILVLSAASAGAQTNLPDGPGKAAFLKICSGCHDLESVVRSRNSRERWGEIVDDMVSRGAQGSDDQIEKVIDYLAVNFGSVKKVSVNKAAAGELAVGLGISAKEADAIVEYRGEHGAFKELGDLKKVPGIDGGKVDGWKDRVDFR